MQVSSKASINIRLHPIPLTPEEGMLDHKKKKARKLNHVIKIEKKNVSEAEKI